MPMCKLTVPVRVASLVLIGAVVSGCRPDTMGPGPELTAAFAKPAVQAPKAATFTFASADVSSDGRGSYAEGVCGVVARVFYLAPTYLDANLQLNAPSAKDKNCSAGRRTIRVAYPGGGEEQGSGLNVNDLGTVTSTITSELRPMNLPIVNGTRCKRLGFGNLLGGDMVNVIRVNSTTWNVSFNGTAICESVKGANQPISLSMNFNVALN